MPGNTVIVRFLGEDSSLRRSLKSLTDETAKFESVSKWAFVGAATHISGAVPAVASLAGAVFLIPGAIAVAGAAMATFKIATAGVGDALGAVGEDADKFNEAIKDLAPNAQTFVKEVRNLRGEWKDLQQTVQNELFAGFGEDVKRLGGTYIPKLKMGLSGIAASMNSMARYAANALMKPDVVAAVNTVLANTFNLFEELIPSLGDFLDGFLKLAAIGSDYLPAVGTWLSNIARDFRDWVTANPDKIREFIDGALTTLRDLWEIGVNIKDLFVNMFSGSTEGQTFLTILKDTTRFLADNAEVVKGVLYAMATIWVVGKVAAFASAVAGVVSSLSGLWPILLRLMPYLKFVGVIGAIGAAGAAFDEFQAKVTGGDKVIPTTLDNWKGAIDQLATAFSTWNFQPVFDDFAEDWQKLVDGIVNGTSPIGAALHTVRDGLMEIVRFLAGIPGPWQATCQAIVAATDKGTGSVDRLRGSVGALQSKYITVTEQGAQGAAGRVNWLKSSVDALRDKTISVTVLTRGFGDVGLNAAAHGRAVGGTVNKGQTYLVGERGPEYLTMPASGSVVPNHRMATGAGSGGGVTINFGGQTDGAFAAAFMKMVRTGAIQLQAT